MPVLHVDQAAAPDGAGLPGVPTSSTSSTTRTSRIIPAFVTKDDPEGAVPGPVSTSVDQPTGNQSLPDPGEVPELRQGPERTELGRQIDREKERKKMEKSLHHSRQSARSGQRPLTTAQARKLVKKGALEVGGVWTAPDPSESQ